MILKATTSALHVNFFCVLVISYAILPVRLHRFDWKKFCSCVLFMVSIEELFDNLEYSGKRNYCFGKSLQKSRKLLIKKSVRTLYKLRAYEPQFTARRCI